MSHLLHSTVKNGENQEDKADDKDFTPKWIVLIPLIYIAIAAITAFYYAKSKDNVLLELSGRPAIALWFGMVGGTLDGLQKMISRRGKWRTQYGIWYGFSGVIGGAYGLVSYLALLAIDSFGGGKGESSFAIISLAAFAIGYQQNKFHTLMDEIFKLIFQESKP